MSMIFAVFLLKFMLNLHHLGDLKYCLTLYRMLSSLLCTLLTSVVILAHLRFWGCQGSVHQAEAPEALNHRRT